ncbi:hypothetical protein KCU81_g789, partial [Aureobasidium melanogenum]
MKPALLEKRISFLFCGGSDRRRLLDSEGEERKQVFASVFVLSVFLPRKAALKISDAEFMPNSFVLFSCPQPDMAHR